MFALNLNSRRPVRIILAAMAVLFFVAAPVTSGCVGLPPYQVELSAAQMSRADLTATAQALPTAAPPHYPTGGKATPGH
jgi:hypothetical protein